MPVGEAQQRSAEELSRTPPTKSLGGARRRRKAVTVQLQPMMLSAKATNMSVLASSYSSTQDCQLHDYGNLTIRQQCPTDISGGCMQPENKREKGALYSRTMWPSTLLRKASPRVNNVFYLIQAAKE